MAMLTGSCISVGEGSKFGLDVYLCLPQSAFFAGDTVRSTVVISAPVVNQEIHKKPLISTENIYCVGAQISGVVLPCKHPVRNTISTNHLSGAGATVDKVHQLFASKQQQYYRKKAAAWVITSATRVVEGRDGVASESFDPTTGDISDLIGVDPVAAAVYTAQSKLIFVGEPACLFSRETEEGTTNVHPLDSKRQYLGKHEIPSFEFGYECRIPPFVPPSFRGTAGSYIYSLTVHLFVRGSVEVSETTGAKTVSKLSERDGNYHFVAKFPLHICGPSSVEAPMIRTLGPPILPYEPSKACCINGRGQQDDGQKTNVDEIFCSHDTPWSSTFRSPVVTSMQVRRQASPIGKRILRLFGGKNICSSITSDSSFNESTESYEFEPPSQAAKLLRCYPIPKFFFCGKSWILGRQKSPQRSSVAAHAYHAVLPATLRCNAPVDQTSKWANEFKSCGAIEDCKTDCAREWLEKNKVCFGACRCSLPFDEALGLWSGGGSIRVLGQALITALLDTQRLQNDITGEEHGGGEFFREFNSRDGVYIQPLERYLTQPAADLRSVKPDLNENMNTDKSSGKIESSLPQVENQKYVSEHGDLGETICVQHRSSQSQIERLISRRARVAAAVAAASARCETNFLGVEATEFTYEANALRTAVLGCFNEEEMTGGASAEPVKGEAFRIRQDGQVLCDLVIQGSRSCVGGNLGAPIGGSMNLFFTFANATIQTLEVTVALVRTEEAFSPGSSNTETTTSDHCEHSECGQVIPGAGCSRLMWSSNECVAFRKSVGIAIPIPWQCCASFQTDMLKVSHSLFIRFTCSASIDKDNFYLMSKSTDASSETTSDDIAPLPPKIRASTVLNLFWEVPISITSPYALAQEQEQQGMWTGGGWKNPADTWYSCDRTPSCALNPVHSDTASFKDHLAFTDTSATETCMEFYQHASKSIFENSASFTERIKTHLNSSRKFASPTVERVTLI